ncbi:MAG: dihydrodipicolinate reductase [Acidobacteriota bacterium]
MSHRPVPIVLFGLGAIGRAVARAALVDPGFRVVGAVDREPALVGRSLAALTRAPTLSSLKVRRELHQVPGRGKGRVLVHTAGSRLTTVFPQLEAILEAGYAVVSSCEELAWPWDDHPVLARRLDRMARAARSPIFATGVNPGFVMDLLPVVLTGVTRRITAIRATRVVDAATRRIPLQRKVGAGLPPPQFRSLVRQGRLGHVGLVNSARLIARAVGWKLDQVTTRVRPVLSTGRHPGPVPVKAGAAAGLHQVVIGKCRAREVIRLDLIMAIGAAEPHDRIQVHGAPPLDVTIRGGVPGDQATVAALLNAAFTAREAAHGLHTALDLPLPRAHLSARPLRRCRDAGAEARPDPGGGGGRPTRFPLKATERTSCRAPTP